MDELSLEMLAPYVREQSDRKIRSSADYTEQVLDFYLNGRHLVGSRFPFNILDEKFRFSPNQVTLLGGINGSGKSLFAGQCLLYCMDQEVKCLSVSLEMSPPSQLARMWRQASLKVEPTLDFGLGFNSWAAKRLYFYDQQGSIDLDTLSAVIQYSYDNYGTKMVLVDSLMGLSGIRHDDYTAQKEVVLELCDIAKKLEIHIMLVAHARKGMSIAHKLDKWSIRGAGELTDAVDNVILLGRYYRDDTFGGEPDAYLSIAKARHFDGAEMDLDLFLDMASLNYYLPGATPLKINMDDEMLES
tara:strand:+ start:103 stop:1002 length:900 start_codon:yes stop_codon:yes gene_type:complete